MHIRTGPRADHHVDLRRGLQDRRTHIVGCVGQHDDDIRLRRGRGRLLRDSLDRIGPRPADAVGLIPRLAHTDHGHLDTGDADDRERFDPGLRPLGRCDVGRNEIKPGRADRVPQILPAEAQLVGRDVDRLVSDAAHDIEIRATAMLIEFALAIEQSPGVEEQHRTLFARLQQQRRPARQAPELALAAAADLEIRARAAREADRDRPRLRRTLSLAGGRRHGEKSCHK